MTTAQQYIPDPDEEEALRAMAELDEMVSAWPVTGHVEAKVFTRAMALVMTLRKGLPKDAYDALWAGAKAGDPEVAYLRRYERERMYHREHKARRKKYHADYRARPENKIKAKAAKDRWRHRQRTNPKEPTADDVTMASIIKELDQ